jgi:trk system potassium uptake protein TrkA
MYVLFVGCGRVGSAIAKRMIKQGHEVSVLDENQEAHALLEHDMDQTWEDAGGRFTVGTALEVEALHEAGIDRADVVVCSTDGDNTNIIVAQLAKKRFQVPKVVVRVLDPYRAEWYHQQGIHTVCPTQVAIDMLTDAVIGEPETVAGGAG